MRKRAAALVAVAASTPAAAAEKHHKYPPGCRSMPCSNRIGAIWAAHHPKARAASFIAPYRAFLAKLRACEVRGQPHPYQTNTSNGFYGAYQFTQNSWYAVGGIGRPDLASPGEQDYRAVRLLRLQGPQAWPVCSQ